LLPVRGFKKSEWSPVFLDAIKQSRDVQEKF
jgi:hypothetical protein